MAAGAAGEEGVASCMPLCLQAGLLPSSQEVEFEDRDRIYFVLKKPAGRRRSFPTPMKSQMGRLCPWLPGHTSKHGTYLSLTLGWQDLGEA